MLFIVTEGAEALGEAGFIYGAELIENDLAGLFLECAGNAGGVVFTACGHWGDYDSGNIAVQLVGGDDETGTSFPNLAPHSRIKVHQPDLEAPYYQLHSSASQFVGMCPSASPSRRASSPASAIA